MKPILLISMPAVGLLTTLAIAQPPSYRIADVGTLRGGTFSLASYVNNNGLVTGVSTVADGTQHAFLWYKGRFIDIAKPGLGGPNSGAFAVNASGQVLALAETSTKDPNGENFCGYGTGLTCRPAIWQNGVMAPLPLLGGVNGTVGDVINNRGEAPGIAENSTKDPECPLTPALNGTGPQVLDFEAVIWGPGPGQIRELPPLTGDTVGMAMWINDHGQAVGSSGRCADTLLPGFAGGPHAVLWEKDGSVHNLGNLGGTANPAVPGVANIGFVINNRGQVTGVSALPGNTTTRAFLWTREKGMQNLGTLPGDTSSSGLGMNDRGDVVGGSSDATGNSRAFLWQNGVMHDLNTIIVGNSPFLQLLVAFGINDVGQIVGIGLTNTGDVHGFLATPGNGAGVGESFSPASQGVTGPVVLPEDVRKLLRGRLGIRGR
jgi:probable HAF family extracellular repeat protein